MRIDLIEAKLCYSIDAFRACAVMARRTMQNACIDKGAKKGDLVNQIKELQTNGTITKDLAEWANVVRWVGNDAAHPNKDSVEKEDAEDILSLAEQFLQVLYVAPAIALSRKTIRGKKYKRCITPGHTQLPRGGVAKVGSLGYLYGNTTRKRP